VLKQRNKYCQQHLLASLPSSVLVLLLLLLLLVRHIL
jgi:hypothetical protein